MNILVVFRDRRWWQHDSDVDDNERGTGSSLSIEPSVQETKRKDPRCKLYSYGLKKGSRCKLCPYWSKKNTFEIQEKGQITVGGFFINADSKNGCNTFSDSIFVNWLQRYSIFGQITRMKQFPFWKKKTTPASDASAISANIWKILQRQTNKHTLCKWLCGCKFWQKI